MNMVKEAIKRIETELEVRTFLARLSYALKSNSTKIEFKVNRKADENRMFRFTNRYTIGKLFPDEDEVSVMRRELSHLCVSDYIETVKYTNYPNKGELRVFGKKYSGYDVYIKLQVNLLGLTGSNDAYILVISFHFSNQNFNEKSFPYKT